MIHQKWNVSRPWSSHGTNIIQYHPISQYVSLQFSRSKIWFWAVIELQEVRTLPGHDGHVQLWLSYTRHSGRRTMTFHPQQEAFTKNDQLILYQLYLFFIFFTWHDVDKFWLFAPSLLSAKKKSSSAVPILVQNTSNHNVGDTITCRYEYSVTCLTCCLVVPSLLQLDLL